MSLWIRGVLLLAMFLSSFRAWAAEETPAQVPPAQDAPPGTDIFLVPARGGDPVNLTHRAGYDNQPAFISDGALLYTSIRGGQADIYRLDIASGASKAVAVTPESEYSPTPIPGSTDFSVVRVEADNRQRLWRCHGREFTLLLPDIEPVGYHAWRDAGEVALFVLGEPPTLQMAHPGSGTGQVISRGIGRGLARNPMDGRITFLDASEDEHWIAAVTADDTVQRLIPARPGSEDFAFMPDGRLLMAQGNRIYAWDGHGTWETLMELAGPGPVTRLAVSPDGGQLAFVAPDP